MAIVKAGVFSENAANGDYWYGAGAAGSLTVNGGSLFTIAATTGTEEPDLAIGVNAGATGTASFANGSTLTVTSRTSNQYDSAGINVGRDAVSNGTLNLSGSTATVSGAWEAFMAVGRNGGTGVLNLAGGAALNLTGGNDTTSDGGNAVQIGRNGGNGDVNIDASSLTLGATNAAAVIHVGRARNGSEVAGTGSLDLDNGGQLNLSGRGAVLLVGQAGQGTLTAETSSAITLGNSDSARSAFMTIGVSSGTGNAQLSGSSVTINSAGSGGVNVGGFDAAYLGGGTGTLAMTSGASIAIAAVDASLGVARGDVTNSGLAGGTGTMTMGVGTSVTLTSTAAAGSAGFQVGRGFGSVGQLTLTGASITVESVNDVGVNVGRVGGQGTLTLNAGASLALEGGNDVTSDGFNGMQVGRHGGTGTVNVNAASMTFLSAGSGSALHVGRSVIGETAGTGTVNLDSGATVSITGLNAFVNVGERGSGTLNVRSGSTLSATATSSDEMRGLGFVVGQSGGNGTLNLNAGTIDLESASGCFAIVGAYNDSPEGSGGGTGTLNAVNGQFLMSGVTASFNVGMSGDLVILPPGDGTATFSTNSQLRVEALTGDGVAELNVGDGLNSSGELTFNSSTALIHGSNVVDAVVGENDGFGVLTINSGSSVTLSGGSLASGGTNSFRVGGNGGTGAADINGGTLTQTASAANVSFEIGRSFPGSAAGTGGVLVRNGGTVTVSSLQSTVQIGVGGTGELVLLGGAEMTVASTGATQQSDLYVGVDGGDGSVVVNDAGLALSGANGVAVVVGSYGDVGNSGTGELQVINGGLLEASATGGGSALLIGRGGTSDALVEVLTGGDIDFSGAPDSYLAIGDRSATSTARLVIDGTGSSVAGFDTGTVGRNALDGGSPAGNGVVDVRNGGVLGVDWLNVGSGGVLMGNGGSLAGSLSLNDGTLDFTDGVIGTFAVAGAAELNAGTLRFEMAGGGANDRLNTQTALVNLDEVEVTVLGGYTFTAGETRTLITATAGPVNIVDPVPGQLPLQGVSISGQATTFANAIGVLAGQNNLIFRALNAGATGGSAILDFGQASAAGVVVRYDVEADVGSGHGGAWREVHFRNVTDIRGTDQDDNMLVGPALGAGPYAGITLNGRGGADILAGGHGDDRVNGGDGNDLILAGLGTDTLDGGVGLDAVSYADASGGVAVSLRITLTQATGGSGSHRLISIERLVGSGHDDELEGSGNADTLEGGNGNDTMAGLGGNDTIVGGEGADTISGGDGDDSLNGGNGIDMLTYEDAAAGVSVDLRVSAAQNTVGAGLDIVTAFEHLGGSDFADRLIGSNGDNVLFGDFGNDVIYGMAGNDTIDGSFGNDTLYGGTGLNTLTGGSGDDVYYVEVGTDVIIEAASSGYDTVNTSVNLTLGSTTSVERIVARVNTGLSLTGNDINNFIEGGGGADTLVGLGGNDTLDGKTGVDRMVGGAGNDLYVVDASGDVVVELGGEGTDRVNTSVSYTLSDHIETLIASATAGAVTLAGNGLANRIDGAAGNDTISGAAGADTIYGRDGNDRIVGGEGIDNLFGGAGVDTFVLLPTLADRDTIRDFAAGTDRVEISAAVFGAGLVAGQAMNLPGLDGVPGTGDDIARFRVNASGLAQDADDRFIFSTNSNALYFDADGNGAGARIQIATFVNGVPPLATDFIIVA